MSKRRLVTAGTFFCIAAAIGWSGLVVLQRRADALPADDFWAHVDGPRKPWRPVGRMDPAVVRESSGIVASRRHQGIFWTHGDSFNPPVIFAVTEDGTIMARVAVRAPNVDWEDIAIDDDGYLYLADIGNNLRFATPRHVYKIAEPDPHADDGRTVSPVASYTFSYPNEPFDAEAFFVHAGRMYLVSRHDDNRARVYRFDPGAGGRVTLHEIAALRVYRAGGADVSRDGTRLAVCTIRDTWVYRVNPDMTPMEGAGPQFVRYPPDQVEGCAFAGDDLILSNEKGELFRVSADDIRDQVIYVPPDLLP